MTLSKTPPVGIVAMDDTAHKTAPRPVLLTSPQSTEDRDVSAAALARSLAERMQKTYPFAPSPATQVHLARTRGSSGLLCLDAIMNATPVTDRPVNNENISQNSEAQVLELSPSGGVASGTKSSLAFILGRGKRAETSGEVDGRHPHGTDDLDVDVDVDSEEGDWGGVSSDASTGALVWAHSYKRSTAS